MKNAQLVTLVMALLSLSPASAQSADTSRLYASATVGVGFLGSQDLTYRDATTTATGEADFDASFTGGGAIGYYVTPQWRIEGEIMYRRNDMDEITLAGVGASTEGDFASLGFGLSALYEFSPAANDRLRLYAGGGPVWIQEIDIDFEVDGAEVSFETDDVAFQIQGGARYSINDRAFVDVGLRYLTASGVELEFPADRSRTIESDYAPFTATVSVGWRF